MFAANSRPTVGSRNPDQYPRTKEFVVNMADEALAQAMHEIRVTSRPISAGRPISNEACALLQNRSAPTCRHAMCDGVQNVEDNRRQW